MTASAAASRPSGGEGSPKYQLTSDIAQLCLPIANQDESRRVAYACSITLAFLVIGIVGVIKVPLIIDRPLPELVEIVPVEFTPPDDAPPPEPDPNATPEPAPPDAPMDTPTVVVAVANSAEVNFAVAVEGPVVLATSARYAGPPPEGLRAPPRPVTKPPEPAKFNWARSGEGSFAKPAYSSGALPPGEHVVTLQIWVDANGSPTKVEVQKSCGSLEVDRKTSQHVRNRWRWKSAPDGKERQYVCDIQFNVN